MGVVAALAVRLTADTSDLTRGFTEVDAQAGKLASSVSRVSGSSMTASTGLDKLQTSLASNRDESLKAGLAMIGMTDSHAAFTARLADTRAKLDALTTGVETNQTSIVSNMLAMGGWVLAIEAAGIAGRAWANFLLDSVGEFDKQTGAMAENKAALARLSDDWRMFQALLGGFVTGGANGATLIDGLAGSFERLTPALANAVANATGLKGIADFIRLVDASSSWIFGEGPTRRVSIKGGLVDTGAPVPMLPEDLKGLTDGPKKFIDALEKAEKENAKAAAATNKALKQLTGQDRLDSAAKLIADIGRVGGLGNVAPDQILKVHRELDDALEILATRGQMASQQMVNLWAASLPPLKVITGINNLIDAQGRLMLGTRMPAPTAPMPPLPGGPGVIPGLGGLGMPGTVIPIGTIDHLFVNPFREAFGNLGQQLPNLIFGTLMAGGSVIGALASGLGSEFARLFQERLAAASKSGTALGGAATGLGLAGMGLSAGLGGFAMGQQFGKTKGALAGAASGALAGAAFGSVVPVIGTALGAGIGAIAGGIGGFFGGRSKDKKDRKAMEEQRQQLLDQFGGMEKLSALAKDLGVNIDLAFTTKKPLEFQTAVESLNTALEKQQLKFEGIGMVLDGVNARASVFGDTLKTAAEKHGTELAAKMKGLGISPDSSEGKALATQSQGQFTTANQSEFDRVGTMAVSSFAMQMQTSGSAVEALAAMAPTLAVLTEAQGQFNFVAGDTVQKLLGISAAVEANRPAFSALAADGQIVRGMLQGNLMDLDLFKAVSSDITSQIGGIIANGVPLSQALALSQPQLQALWEAQEKFGFETDEATSALLTQAETQGIVGPQMKSAQDKILDVLLAIGKVLGADIPGALAKLPAAAESAAGGMNTAFGKVRGPSFAPGDTTVDAPAMASGGIVRRPTLALIGEAGPEAVVPLDGAFNGGSTTVIWEADGRPLAEIVVPHIPGVVQRYGLA